MLIILVFICFCLTAISDAETNINSVNSISSPDQLSPSSPPFDMDNAFCKIFSSCFTERDYELLTGDNLRYNLASRFSFHLLSAGSSSIGLAELRRALNFAPLDPLKRHTFRKPSEEVLASAPSIEAYYNMVEPIPSELSPDNGTIFEKVIIDAIAYLDKRLPSIRIIYRHRFEEMHRLNNGLIDRESIKRMTDELDNIDRKIRKTITSC